MLCKKEWAVGNIKKSVDIIIKKNSCIGLDIIIKKTKNNGTRKYTTAIHHINHKNVHNE